ncbi:MAG TPA: hypothetical protein VJR29_09520 [bacterium]|nr:hypothetical protein [bacterium]
MADTYVTNQGFTPINNQTREMLRQDASFQNRQDVVGDRGFGKALGIASDVISIAGPAAGAATPFMGMKGGAITSAALSTLGGGQTPGYVPPGLSYGSGTGKFLAPPGGAPGYPGAGGGSPIAGGLGSAPGYPGAGMPAGADQTGQFNSQIDSMMNNNLTFLALQTKVQNVSQMSQMMSNIAKTDSDAKLNAIRNVRA